LDPHNLTRLTEPLMRNAAAPTTPTTLATVDLKNGDAVRQWIDVKRTYEELRSVRPAANRKHVPRTTVGDIKAIAAKWSEELKKVKPRNRLDKVEHDRWRACLEEVTRATTGLTLSAEYPAVENERFWQKCTNRLSIYLESRKVVPSRWKLAVSALGETLAEVPATLGGATRSAAGVAASIVREPAKLAAVLLGAAVLGPPLVRAFRGK